MTVTIQPPDPGTHVGPGFIIKLISDFFGPLPVGSFVQLQIQGGSDLISQVYLGQTHTQQTTTRIHIAIPGNDISDEYRTDLAVPQAGDTVKLQAQVNDTTGVVDSGQANFLWDPTGGLPAMIQAQGSGTGGGLTGDQADQLAQAANQTNQILGLDPTYPNDTIATVQLVVGQVLDGITATIGSGVDAVETTLGTIFSGQTFDKLTTLDAGSSCAPDPLVINLSGGGFFGVQIQVTSHPDWITFTTAGEDYAVQTLFDLKIERGGNIVQRQGIHTLSHMIYPLPAIPWFSYELALPQIPLDYVITVTPANECCVSAQVLEFP